MDAPVPNVLVRALREPKRMAYRFIEMVWSAIFVSRPGQAIRQAWLARRSSRPTLPLRVALVAHVYYPDLFGEILAAHATLPAGSALIVTAPEDRQRAILALCPCVVDLRIHPAPNRGRDVAPFLAVLNAGALDEFDVVLKLHTKKSPHLLFGGIRRRMIFLSLAGHRLNVDRILAQFAGSAAGLIGLRTLFRSRPSFWMANRDRVIALCARMRPPAPVQLGFFEGTMFWVRVAALAPLRAASIETGEFDAETGQLDGTLQHALERTFSLSALAAGYELRDISGELLSCSA